MREFLRRRLAEPDHFDERAYQRWLRWIWLPEMLHVATTVRSKREAWGWFVTFWVPRDILLLAHRLRYPRYGR